MDISSAIRAVVIPDSAELEDGTLVRCEVSDPPASDIEVAVNDPGWGTLRELRFKGPPSSRPSGKRRIDLVLAPAMNSLRTLRGLAWPEFSQLCKHNSAVPIELVEFEWGPGEHVVTRLQETRSLPQLRHLIVRAPGSFDERVGPLFDQMAAWGRPIDCMQLITGTSLANRHNVALSVELDEGTRLIVATVQPGVTDADIREISSGFGFPQPSRIETAKSKEPL